MAAAHSLMVFGRAQVFVATLLLVTSAAAAAHDLSQVNEKCKMALGKISQTPYNSIELAALCRSRAPAPICRETLSSLGEKPWAPERIAATCDRWQRDFQMRMLELSPAQQRQMLGDLQASVDDITSNKAALGICKDQTVDACASTKKEEYPKYNRKLTEAVQLKSDLKPQQYTIAPLPVGNTRDIPAMPESTSPSESTEEDIVVSTTAHEAGQKSEPTTSTVNTGNSTEVVASTQSANTTTGQGSQENATTISADSTSRADMPTTTTSAPMGENESAQLQQKDLVITDADAARVASSPSRLFLLLFGLPVLLLSAVASAAILLRAQRVAVVYTRATVPDDEECIPVRSRSAAQ